MIPLGGVVDFYVNPGTDWLLCDSGNYARVDYPDLYAALNDAGSPLVLDADNFEVPNLIGFFRLGTDESAGSTGGAATHTLTTGEMPAHTHSVIDPGVLNAQAGTGAIPLSDPGIATTTGSTGGGGAHNNMPPYNTAYPYIRAR